MASEVAYSLGIISFWYVSLLILRWNGYILTQAKIFGIALLGGCHVRFSHLTSRPQCVSAAMWSGHILLMSDNVAWRLRLSRCIPQVTRRPPIQIY
jgi:hypothetical protein